MESPSTKKAGSTNRTRKMEMIVPRPKQEPMVENEEKQSKFRRKAGNDPRGERFMKQGEGNCVKLDLLKKKMLQKMVLSLGH